MKHKKVPVHVAKYIQKFFLLLSIIWLISVTLILLIFAQYECTKINGARNRPFHALFGCVKINGARIPQMSF